MGTPILLWPRLLGSCMEQPGPMPDPCRVWLRPLGTQGYGMISVNGKQRGAHRAAYEYWVGPVPEGLELDHLCRNRACVNPAHLEAVTRAVNIRRSYEARGASFDPERARENQRRASAKYRSRFPRRPNCQSEKTHCPQGHPYDEENTYHIPSRPTARYCKACAKQRQDAQRKRPV